jgi:hypothetical protein
LDLSVSLYGILLSSNQNYALYKWIDCSTGLIIPNEIYQSYNMLNEGSYSVVVSLPNCSDTSECYPQITLINENSLPINELVVMPNPASDLITIISSEITQAYITSLNGNVIERVSINGDAIVDVSNYKSGVYFVRTLSGFTSIFIKQ